MNKIFFLIIIFFLASCSTVKEGFSNNKKNNSDEFLVEKKSPLVMPPNYGQLPEPKELKKKNKEIEYLCVGGENLKALGIKSVYDLKDITYIGFTSVISNIFKINKKINETVKIITEFEPDILFTVDSPDFTLRVAEKVKKKKF